eukprot:gene21526-28512_t
MLTVRALPSLDESQSPFVATRLSPQRRYVNSCYVRLPLPRTVLICTSTIVESKSDLQHRPSVSPHKTTSVIIGDLLSNAAPEGLPVTPHRSVALDI